MTEAKSAGRWLGLFVLIHIGAGLVTPFIMLDRVRGEAGLLANAAGDAGLFRAAVLLLFLGSAMAIAAALSLGVVLRRHSVSMGPALLALAVAAFVLQVMDNSALMALLALSREQARGAVDPALAAVAQAGRRWAHYSYLFVAVSWICLLNTALFRHRLIPRVLAGLGVLASLSQIAGVSAPGLLGLPPVFALAMPLGPAYVAVALWLLVRGLPEAPDA
jgi:hypothetical protein